MAHALAAVLLAGVVAGIQGADIPFTGRTAAGWTSPGATIRSRSSGRLAMALDNPALGIEALILAVAAGALPYLTRRGDLCDRELAAAAARGTLLAAPRAGTFRSSSPAGSRTSL